MKIPESIGWGGSDQDKLHKLLNDIAADLAALTTVVNDLRAKHDAHAGATDMHYNGSAGVTDTVNVVDGSDVTLKTTPSDNYSG
ncbi:MAG: hypothetical protein ACM3X6_02865 [Patescibacteria group bacterium]